MNTPVPYGKTSLLKSPLSANGADYPCQQRTGVYDKEGANNIMPQGSTQKLSFTGSAVHGGGSCQVSLTTDLKPTKGSTFKVIHSIEGGCPARNAAGNLGDNPTAANPDTYQFTIPNDLAPGDYTLAWTWFNKIGNREMYMNCAPVTVTGGNGGSANATAKRDEGSLVDDTIFGKRAGGSLNSLPDMFIANIGNCKTNETVDLVFPNPGASVEKLGNPKDLQLTTCPGTLGVSSGGSAGGSSGGSAGGSSGGSAVAPSSTASSSTTSAPQPSNPGGVFVPSASAAPSVASSVAAVAPSAPAPIPSSGTSAPSTSGGSGGALSGTCTTEGMFNCVGGSSFQQCASGTWSVVQPMAAGTKCSAGQTQSLNITAGKRSVRFSHGHIRRRYSIY